jgi:hypothetical protein
MIEKIPFIFLGFKEKIFLRVKEKSIAKGRSKGRW